MSGVFFLFFGRCLSLDILNQTTRISLVQRLEPFSLSFVPKDSLMGVSYHSFQHGETLYETEPFSRTAKFHLFYYFVGPTCPYIPSLPRIEAAWAAPAWPSRAGDGDLRWGRAARLTAVRDGRI